MHMQFPPATFSAKPAVAYLPCNSQARP